MKLYVANCTAQDHDFVFRLPEVTNLRMQKIHAGQQVAISGDLNQHEVDAIVRQHQPYGLASADNLDQAKPFIGLCYSVDKPVPASRLNYAFEHNKKVLIQRGQEIQKETAVSVNHQLETVNEGLGRVGQVSVELREERKDGGVPDVNTQLNVVKPGESPPPPRRRKSA